MKFNRRAVIRTGLAAAAAMPFAAAEAKAASDKKWDKTADVVVIGYGGAGACAAISAHDAGASVIILEKMNEGGGNTLISSGGIMNPNNEEEALKHIRGLFASYPTETDEEFLKIFVHESMHLVDWIKGLKEGTRMRIYGHAGYPQVAGADSMDKWSVSNKAPGSRKGGGPNLWAVYTHAVEEVRKIPVMLSTAVQRLITNAQGDVIGVKAESAGKSIRIRATRGVVLACGGFEYDTTELTNSIKGQPMLALGNPGNTGDGLRMAQAVGAGLWHMTGCNAPLGVKIPGQKAACTFRCSSAGYILVDRTGERFVDEKSIEGHAGILAVDSYDGRALKFQRIPCYAIFDHKGLTEGGPISRFGSGYFRLIENGGHVWSNDNLDEVQRGWIIKANSVKELASKLGLEPEVLEATVSRWNKDVHAGKDTLFDRPIQNKTPEGKEAYEYMKAKVHSTPLETGPFYAVELYPCVMNTQGGPRRNARCEVLTPFREPIGHLYSAGELGSFWGPIYQGAGNNAECIVTGRIAGRNAALSKPSNI